MNTNYSFPRRQQAPTQPFDAPTESGASPSQSDARKSSALRASVLDAALQLGFGSDSQVAKWMFNDGDDENEDLPSPGLTAGSTAPSVSDDSSSYMAPRPAPTFSPPVFPVKANHLRRPSSEPFAHVTQPSDISQESDSLFDKPPQKPRNKLVKKRSDGHISDGGYLSESVTRKKPGKDLSKAEKKELERIITQREKEEKKQRKAAKKMEKESGFTTGYDTDAVDATSNVKKSKKKSKVKSNPDGGFETDDGNMSSTSSKKPKSKFFRLGNRSKGEVDREEESEIPPVPELPPIHPIADKFATTLSLDIIDARSLTPTPAASLYSSQPSFTSSFETSRTIPALPNESTTTLSTLDMAPSRPSADSSLSCSTATAHASGDSFSRPITPYQDNPSRVAELDDHEVAPKPPKLIIPSPNSYEPFIRRSPQNTPLRSPNPSRLNLPSRPVGLPASPRPADAAQIPVGSCRSPVPHSARSLETFSSQAGLPTPVSPLYTESTRLRPGPSPTPNGRTSPSALSVMASSEYIVTSPLPSPRVPSSQYGVPPPTPPPTSPLPPPPQESYGRSSPYPSRSPFPNVSAGLEARVRSQRYNRDIYARPARAVRSEDGHGLPPSANRGFERGRRHQSANAAPTTMSSTVTSSPEREYEPESMYPSPVEGMHDILARYQHVEPHKEVGSALARNQSIKYWSHTRAASDVDDDESHYPDDEAGEEWRYSIMDGDKSQEAHNRLLDHISYDDSDHMVPSSPFTHQVHGIPAGAVKPGWI